MAGCSQPAREAAAGRRPALRGLRARAGASDARARAGTRAGPALSPVPPRRHAATQDGPGRARRGRSGTEERRQPDRAERKRPVGRGPLPAAVEVAPARPEGGPRRARSRVRENGPTALTERPQRVEVNRDGESGHVGRRRSAERIEGANDTVGDAVPALWKAQGALLPLRREAESQPGAAPRSVFPVPARTARLHPERGGLTD